MPTKPKTSAHWLDQIGELAARQPKEGTEALAAWRAEAAAALAELTSRKVPKARQVQAAELALRLLQGLYSVCLELADRAYEAYDYDGSLAAAEEANQRYRQLIAAQVADGAVSPDLLDPAATLKQARALYMLKGATPELLALLQQALAQSPEHQELIFWAARYERLAAPPKGEPEQPAATPMTMMMMRDDDSLDDYSRYDYDTDIDQQLDRVESSLDTDPINPPSDLPQRQLTQKAFAALAAWTEATRAMKRGVTASAIHHFRDCRAQALAYLRTRKNRPVEALSTDEAQRAAVHEIGTIYLNLGEFTNIQASQHMTARRAAVSREALDNIDFANPRKPITVTLDSKAVTLELQDKSEHLVLALVRNLYAEVNRSLDAPLLALLLIHIPLGLAEAYRMQRAPRQALPEVEAILTNNNTLWMLNQELDLPFIEMLRGILLLEIGDQYYKERNTGPAKAHYEQILGLFGGVYTADVQTGLDLLSSRASGLLAKEFHPLAAQGAPAHQLSPQERAEFEQLGKSIPVASLTEKQQVGSAEERRLEGLQAGEAAATRYHLVLSAKAKVLQIDAGLNYLGYTDSYVPPWNFQFLLQRARAFAEHARSAQVEYRNLLHTAENQDASDLNLSQAVALEAHNVTMETARVSQALQEIEAVKKSAELARLTATNARQRLKNFVSYDAEMRGHEAMAETGAILGAVGGVIGGAALSAAQGNPAALVGSLFSGAGQIVGQQAQTGMAVASRDLERKSLGLAAREAEAAADVALKQTLVALEAMKVAALNRAGALMRQSFAQDSLQKQRNRALNTDTWFRLAALMRSVSETYLAYAVEMAFLAEQAYEFEADKQADIIRFDYDASELGDMLAGDFLMADLNALEHDLIVTQRSRQQQVRYVLSLAREYPEALQQLRETGSTIFMLPLEQLERRFPGLFSVRVAAVDVTPLALMDPTRFSMELTHMGISQVRVKGSRGAGDPNLTVPSWLTDAADAFWPVKRQVREPQTAIFSGLSRADRDAIFAFQAGSQHRSFEHMGLAAAWRLDMSMQENRIDPRTLADIQISFTCYGYHDADLRRAVESAPRPPVGLTQTFSARTQFPDQFYSFQQSGKLTWNVTPQLLTLDRPVGALRNLHLQLIPAVPDNYFHPLACRYAVQFSVSGNGSLIVPEIPRLKFLPNQLTLTAQAEVSPGTRVMWEFGDGSPAVEGADAVHTYQRPGRYQVLVRVIRQGRLSEFRASVVVSRTAQVAAPLTLCPVITRVPSGEPGKTKVAFSTELLPGEGGAAVAWRIQGDPVVRSGLAPEPFAVTNGRTYTVVFTAVRDLNLRLYSQQRYTPEERFACKALGLSSNREFDEVGNELRPSSRNQLAQHLFSGGEISPADQWVLELPVAENPALRTVTPHDREEIDLSLLFDAQLVVEYDAGEPALEESWGQPSGAWLAADIDGDGRDELVEIVDGQPVATVTSLSAPDAAGLSSATRSTVEVAKTLARWRDVRFAGDFQGRGHDQLLFLNRTDPVHKAMVAELSVAPAASLAVRHLQEWGENRGALPPHNLLSMTQASFEAEGVWDEATGGFGWQPHTAGGGTGTVAVVTDESFHGSRSLKIVKNDGRGAGSHFGAWTPLKLTAGRTYVISAWVKANVTGSVIIRGDLGGKWETYGVYRGPVNTWQRIFGLVVATGSETAGFKIQLMDGDGTAWFDCVSVYEAGPYLRQNLLGYQQAGFEYGAWNDTGMYQPVAGTGATGSITLTKEHATSGYQSLKVTKTDSGSNIYGAAVRVALEVGKLYRFSAWVRRTGGRVRMEALFGGTALNYVWSNGPLDAWERLTGLARASATTGELRLTLDYAGTAYFDDVEVVEESLMPQGNLLSANQTSFEQGTLGDWQAHSAFGGAGTVSVVDGGMNGSKCLKIAKTDAGSSEYGVVVTPALTKGRTYQISAWVKLESAAGASIVLQGHLGASWQVYAGAGGPLNTWQRISGQVTVQTEEAPLRLMFIGGTGVAYCDAVSVVEAPVQLAGNLLGEHHGTFETGILSADWKTYGLGGGAGLCGIAREERFGSNPFATKLTKTNYGTGEYGVYVVPQGLEAGATYVVGAWVKANTTGRVHLQGDLGAGPEIYGTYAGPVGSWQRLSGRFVASGEVGRQLKLTIQGGPAVAFIGAVELWRESSVHPLLDSWLQPTVRQFAGDFMGLGYQQVLFLDADLRHGRVMIADFMEDGGPGRVHYWEHWGQDNLLHGWHGPEDYHLVGDFAGLGYDQLMLINRAAGGGGRVLVLDFKGANARGIGRYWESYPDPASPDPNLQILDGMHDPEDLMLAGDFLKLGYDQVMFINRSGQGKRVMIADFKAGKPPVAVRYLETWAQTPWMMWGWVDAADSDAAVVGDFLGQGYDQLMLVNRGRGHRLELLDFSSGTFPAKRPFWEE